MIGAIKYKKIKPSKKITSYLVDMLSYCIEIGVYAFFLITLVSIRKHGTKQDWYALVFGIAYAIGFEMMGIKSGDYSYEKYLLGIGGLPVYIPLCRSLLLSQAIRLLVKNIQKGYEIVENKNVTSFLQIFLATCYVVSFDIVIDVIAVKTNLRTRHLQPHQGRFGVAYGNYFGRFCVSFLFLFFTTFLKGNTVVKRLKGTIASLVARGGFLVIALLLIKAKAYTTFSRLFLIPINIVLLGTFVFLFRPKRKDENGQKTTLPFFHPEKITDWLFLIIHGRGVFMSIYLHLHSILIGIAIVFFTVHAGYVFQKYIIKDCKMGNLQNGENHTCT